MFQTHLLALIYSIYSKMFKKMSENQLSSPRGLFCFLVKIFDNNELFIVCVSMFKRKTLLPDYRKSKFFNQFCEISTEVSWVTLWVPCTLKLT